MFPMRQAHLLERISKALHAQYDRIADEPLPERWVELINHLNEKERAQGEARQSEPEPRPERQRSN
jgi:hypothetical protein